VAERPGLIRLAVFGMPVASSLSPAIHHQFAQQCGLDVDYRAIESSPENFEKQVRDFADSGARGCNITVPLKHAAWKLALSCSASAERAQAANTLVFEGPGDFFADNTDGRGLVADLVQRLAKALANSRILIMGAGGAAAGILGDLMEQAPAEIVLVNRSPERANALALRFASLGVLSSCSMDQLERLGSFDLIINATSLGHAGFVPVMPASLFTSSSLCYDLNYGQVAEPLRKYCENRGIEYRDGLGMLVEQAAIAFRLWTGGLPDSNAVLQNLRKDH
jgi:shikimate dehydrogenase